MMDRSALDALLEEVMKADASDLHITVGITPTLRVHGALRRLPGDPLTPEQTMSLVLAAMTPVQREKFESACELDFAYCLGDRARFRVNAYFQRGSAGAAFRLIPTAIQSFEELGLPSIMESLSLKPRGLVVITGPTGAGKSTTLASMVDFINSNREVHIMTLEDPIEYVHEHRKSIVNQREVGRDTATFTDGLRFVLRQDPDVILVGEMRDLETMRAALTAAETGHLVLTTLHTQGAVQTVDRIIDVFPPHQQNQVRVQLSMTLQGLISQQLLPRAGGPGLLAACEILVPTPAIRNIIREGKTHQLPTAMETARADGMVMMDRAILELFRSGSITPDVALQKAQDPIALKTLIAVS